MSLQIINYASLSFDVMKWFYLSRVDQAGAQFHSEISRRIVHVSSNFFNIVTWEPASSSIAPTKDNNIKEG